MKKVRSICGKDLLLFLCTVLLLLAGCGASEETQEEEPFELTAENSVEITVVNASGHSVYSFDFRGDGQDREFELINELGRDLEPDEIITIRIPKSENNLYYTFASTDDVGVLVYDIVAPRYIPEGGIFVLPPDNEYDCQIIFEAGTDVETAKETTLAQYQEAYDADHEVVEEEEKTPSLSQEEIDEAVKLLGYDSLADMRTKRNPNITAGEYEREWQAAYYELYGYWYPNGDRNSLTYIAITDEEFMWYQFDPEQGDVQLGKLRLAACSGGRYQSIFTLADGNKFTVERTSVFHELSQGTLTFEDCTKEYSDNVEYYYSKR